MTTSDITLSRQDAGPPTRARLWRLLVDVRGLERRPLEIWRILVISDVQRRVLETQGGQVAVALIDSRADVAPLKTAAAELNVPAWERVDPAQEPDTLLGGPPDVVIEAAEPGPSIELAGQRVIPVSALTLPGRMVSGPPAQVACDGDPLSLRLALLRLPYSAPATLSTARLHRAAETLRRWRVKVAGWADMPSAPALEDRIAPVRAALDADLDTGAVLTSLHRLEVEPHIPSGSKFETFANLDRILALDLCRLVGKLPR